MTCDFDPSALSDEELGEAVCGHAAQVAASTARFVLLAAELDRRGLWCVYGVRSCAHWLNWRCGLSLGAAREHLRVGHALAELPVVRDAFVAGVISYSKVRAVTRAATPATEQHLLELAGYSTASQLEQICRCFRNVCEEEARRRGAVANHEGHRTVTSWTTSRGSLVIHAELPAEEGALVLAGLEANTMALRAEREEEKKAAKEAAREAREAAKAARAATAQQHVPAEDVPAGTPEDEATDPADVPAGTPPDPRPYPTRADALVAMASSALAARPSHVEGTESTRVVIHIDERLRTNPSAPGCCHLEGVGVIPVSLAERLACDASVRTVRYTENGIDLSAPTREITERLRRALRLRDGGCRFPACTARGRLHAHHVWFASRGGPTIIENLCLLCSYHHHLVHEGGYRLAMTKAGKVTVWTPRGDRVPDRPTPLRPVGPPPAAPNMPWGGEGFEMSWVIDGLCGLEFPPQYEPPYNDRFSPDTEPDCFDAA